VSRIQLALRVPDLTASVDFYRRAFGVEPAKVRPGYVNFVVADPPLKLVLVEGGAAGATRLDHLGVEMESTAQVHAATARLAGAGLDTRIEDGTVCCHALQDKVWVRGPGSESWEFYTVLADA
jgi:catechol 2,3-dioxygenase-like lactoylglutathione lyase family enzyme